jgi:hypothetical protein
MTTSFPPPIRVSAFDVVEIVVACWDLSVFGSERSTRGASQGCGAVPVPSASTGADKNSALELPAPIGHAQERQR